MHRPLHTPERFPDKPALAGKVLAVLVALAVRPALAAQECGTATPGGAISCDGDGSPATDANPYPDGISYTIDGLALSVSGAATTIETSGDSVAGVRLTGTGANPVSIEVADGVGVTTTGSNVDFPHGYGGIYLLQQGAGAASVNTAATITQSATSGGSHGIVARTTDTANTEPLAAIVDGPVSVAGNNNRGLYMIHSGLGPLTADVSGDISAPGDSAIGISVRATNSASTAPVMVTATGASSGRIFAFHDGLGTLGIDSRSSIDAEGAGHAVEAFIQSGDSAADLDVTMNGDTGATIATEADNARGIYSRNSGDGAINVTASMPISTEGLRAYGIHTLQDNGSGPGTGVTTVRSAGPVTTSGSEAHAIYTRIYSGESQGLTTVESTAAVTASGADSHAILVENFPETSDSLVSVSGPVSGGSGGGYGITTETGGLATIDLLSGAMVSALSGNAINNDGGPSRVDVQGGASVTGAITLNGGDDSLAFSGGDFSGVSLFDGGAGADTLAFEGSSGLLQGPTVVNWELVRIDSGSTIRFDAADTLATDLLRVEAGGVLQLRDGANDDHLVVAGNFTGSGGTLAMDREVDDGAGAGDLLTITGDTSGVTALEINNVGGPGAATSGDGILVIEVEGASAPGAFTMEPFTVGDYEYSLVQVGSDWYLQSRFVEPPPPGPEPEPEPEPVDPNEPTGEMSPVRPVPALGHWALGLLSALVMILGARRRSAREG